MRCLTIGKRLISDESEPFVIAEIGQNHCGDFDKAVQLICKAAKCGCSAVKFQKRDNKTLYTSELYNAPYLGPQSYGDTYGAHREALEFDIYTHFRLMTQAKETNLIYFSTAFDFKSADELMSIGVPAFKVASGDLKNTPLIRYLSAFGIPVIISTGGGTITDMRRAADAMLHDDYAFLHCVASYPNQPEEMNLRAITSMMKTFPDKIIGLSDHYNGICMTTAAYVLGARIFEKHFTLNHTWKGTDHALSLEPKGMTDMVRDLKRVRLAMGDGVKLRLPSEAGPLKKMEKGLYYKVDLMRGEVLHAEHLAIQSPSASLYPYQAADILGCKLTKDRVAGEAITLEDFE